jgi:hypothetical protein
MRIEDTIQKYIDSENLIYIERKDFEEWAIECIPQKIVGECVVVRNTTDFVNNGYRVVLTCDISDIMVDETTVFREKIYRKAEKNKFELPCFDGCKTLEDILAVLGKEEILISVDAEKDEDCIYLTGKVVSAKDGILTIRCYDELARWERANTVLEIECINAITFYDRCSLVMQRYLKEAK